MSHFRKRVEQEVRTTANFLTLVWNDINRKDRRQSLHLATQIIIRPTSMYKLVALVALWVAQTHAFVARFPAVSTRTQTRSVMAMSAGKIIVSGIGQVDEDEFMLNLLNEQVSAYPCTGMALNRIEMRYPAVIFSSNKIYGESRH